MSHSEQPFPITPRDHSLADQLLAEAAAEVAEKVRQHRIDAETTRRSPSKPLAAFLLGYMPLTVRVWQRHFWQTRNEATAGAMLLAVDEIEQALVALADDLESAALTGFLTKELKNVAKTLDWMRQNFDRINSDQPFAFSMGVVPGSQHWENLCSLSERALDPDSELTAWLSLGTVLGRYTIRLAVVGKQGEIPDLQPVLQHIQRMSQACLDMIPELRRLAQLTTNHQASDQVELQRQVHEALESNPSRDEEPVVAACQVINKLCKVVQNALGTHHIPHSAKPRWDANHRCLLVGSVVVRRYTGDAPNQTRILEAFEAAGWPPRVASPFLEGDRKYRLNKTLRDLNKGISPKLIRFRADGTGTGIRWEPLSSPASG